MNLAAERDAGEAADGPSSELERLLELQAVCAVLDRWPDSFEDEDFWQIAGTYFIRIVLAETEAVEGGPLWERFQTALAEEEGRHREALARPNAERALGAYAFAERTLLVRLIDHLFAYLRRRWIQPH